MIMATTTTSTDGSSTLANQSSTSVGGTSSPSTTMVVVSGSSTAATATTTTTTTTTTTAAAAALRIAHVVNRRRQQQHHRTWLQGMVAVMVLLLSTNASFRSLRTLHDMDGWVEQRRAQLQEPAPPVTHEHRYYQHGQLLMRNNKRPAADTAASSSSSSLSFTEQECKFAIAYMIGGCLPEDASYRYYLYDILISHDNMRREGSRADVVVFVQMSSKSPAEELPAEDVRILTARNIQIIYIPKNEHESFYSVMLDKFRVLSLVQYDRVLFSDGDVLLRGSLDYLCELSVAGVLKENLVLAGKTEPANGGFFMLKPSDDAVARIRQVIRDKELRGAQLEYPHFDRRVGWGHAFAEEDGHINDQYELISHRKFHQWGFHGDFADQGLLYQWVKYEEKSVSIVFRNGIQNWGVHNASTGELVLEAFHRLDVLDTFSTRTKRECWTIQLSAPCRSPFTDYVHFSGQLKPWFRGPPADWQNSTDPVGSWYRELERLNRELRLGLGLDLTKWRTGHRPLLGLYPLHVSAALANYSSATS
jgi:hypothetical protein